MQLACAIELVQTRRAVIVIHSLRAVGRERHRRPRMIDSEQFSLKIVDPAFRCRVGVPIMDALRKHRQPLIQLIMHLHLQASCLEFGRSAFRRYKRCHQHLQTKHFTLSCKITRDFAAQHSQQHADSRSPGLEVAMACSGRCGASLEST